MEAKFWVPGTIISILILLGMNGNVMAIPNTGHIRHESVGNNNPNSDYQAALDVVVPQIIWRTGSRNYDYCTWHRIQQSIAYTRCVCERWITREDCQICLRMADRYLHDSCGCPTRAYIQLTDCQMKFQDRAFSRIP